MKIALAQLNPIVGDVTGNLEKMKSVLKSLNVESVDLVVFPELYLTGYPPCDLLNIPSFIKRITDANIEVCRLSAERPDIGILFGTVVRSNHNELLNAAVLCEKGAELLVQGKQLLPTYDVFDERRYFHRSTLSKVYQFRELKIGVSICEDAWNDPDFETEQLYDINPVEELAKQGAELMINISASPYHLRKEHIRCKRFANHAKKWNTPMIVVGQVGANDELIFDGGSIAIDANGRIIEQLTSFQEDVKIIETNDNGSQ
ncbi:NAD+ synthase, partial [bacterium]|nr:NAD+ synthase [bacterium]